MERIHSPASNAPAEREPSYWKLPARQIAFLVAFFATVAVVVGLRFYRLDTLQAEMFGDIAIVWEYQSWIRDGMWPTNFVMSAGPIYGYLIAPLIAIAGASYLGIKLASVIVSLVTLAMTYLLVRRLAGDRVAVVALFVTGVASWFLIFSRLGNVQVVAPLLIVTPLYFLVRHVQRGGIANLIACAATAPLGLYCMPQNFIHAPVVFLVLLALRWSQRQIRVRELLIFAAVAALMTLPMVPIVAKDRANFFSGYIGGKIVTEEPVTVLLGNVKRALLAFHWRGDGINRSNPPLLPHLDPVSGAFMLLGFVFWLRRPYRRWAPVVLAPLFLLLVPSMLVLQSPQEVPSASRTLAAVPFACILAAGGIWLPAQFLSRKLRPWVGPALVTPILAVILLLNIDRYFHRYLEALPYQNTPIARLVRDYIERLPSGTEAHLVGCCWESGMPEPKGIEYDLPPGHKLTYWPRPDALGCETLAAMPRPAVLIWSYRDGVPAATLEDCSDLGPRQLYASKEGRPVFSAGTLLGRGLAIAAPTSAELSSVAPDLRIATPLAIDSPSAVHSIVANSLQTSSTVAFGYPVEIAHSRIDLGLVGALFDDDRDTLIRGEADNPFILHLVFGSSRPTFSSLTLELGSMVDFAVKITAERTGGVPATSEKAFVALPGEPQLTLEVPGDPAQPLTSLRLEILDRRATPGEGYHVHVRGLRLGAAAPADGAAVQTPPPPAR